MTRGQEGGSQQRARAARSRRKSAAVHLLTSRQHTRRHLHPPVIRTWMRRGFSEKSRLYVGAAAATDSRRRPWGAAAAVGALVRPLGVPWIAARPLSGCRAGLGPRLSAAVACIVDPAPGVAAAMSTNDGTAIAARRSSNGDGQAGTASCSCQRTPPLWLYSAAAAVGNTHHALHPSSRRSQRLPSPLSAGITSPGGPAACPGGSQLQRLRPRRYVAPPGPLPRPQADCGTSGSHSPAAQPWQRSSSGQRHQHRQPRQAGGGAPLQGGGGAAAGGGSTVCQRQHAPRSIASHVQPGALPLQECSGRRLGGL